MERYYVAARSYKFNFQVLVVSFKGKQGERVRGVINLTAAM